MCTSAMLICTVAGGFVELAREDEFADEDLAGISGGSYPPGLFPAVISSDLPIWQTYSGMVTTSPRITH